MSQTNLKAQLQTLHQTLEETRQQLSSNPALTPAMVEAMLAPLHQQVTTLEAQIQTDSFDQREQRVDQQINVARDYVDQRQITAEPGASPEVLRCAYLHRVVQQTRRLPLAGVDPKAVSDEGSNGLQLSAVYTALLTQRPQTDDETLILGDEELEVGYEESIQGLEIETTEDVEVLGMQMLSRVGRIGRATRYLSALETLNGESRLVLLGDPGSGKSTFVNFVALCMAGEALGYEDANLSILTTPLPGESGEGEPEPQLWDHGPLLPVRIVLRDLAARGLAGSDQPVSGDALWAFVVTELGETLKEYAPHLKAELLEQGGLPTLREREIEQAVVASFFAFATDRTKSGAQQIECLNCALAAVNLPNRRKPSGVQRAILEAGDQANLVAQMEEIGLFEVIYTDFTELLYVEGCRKAILMPIIGHASKMAFGWAVGESDDTALALQAWERAKRTFQELNVSCTGMVMHHDRDPVYTGYGWTSQLLLKDELRLSYALRGAKDNLEMESFNGRFKTEGHSLFLEAQSLDELIAVVDDRMRYYNTERRHSSIGYVPPLTYIERTRSDLKT